MKLVPGQTTIGIIGGAGKTGGQFATLFQSQGFTVESTGHDSMDRNAELIKRCDVILFAVPLRSSVEIIEKEMKNALRKDQLILDVSSLKTKQVAAMLKGSGEVIGMHPLFGPSTESHGQTIVLCPARAEEETMMSLTTLIRSMDMRPMIQTPQEHDHLMALLQVLPHVKSLLMADALEGLGADLDHVIETCTPAYEIELNVVGRFLDDTPELYGPIILDNPETLNVLKLLHAHLSTYIALAEQRDLDGFTKRYTELQRYFGDHAKRSRLASEACIRTLTSLHQT